MLDDGITVIPAARAALLGLLLLLAAAPAARADDAASVDALRDLSIDDLANIQVYSVSKSAEPLSDAPAAVYVISHDDIERSGAAALPEILRLAPNLEVASSNADSYAISARGFNGVTANKLLVLIDGRSVYTPLYSGVFWDVQGVMPEDIDHIEVISGPGATLWGANAVNGVINIITKKSGDTQGGVLTIQPGTFTDSMSARFGGALDGHTTWRIYAEGLHDNHTETTTGAPDRDNWQNLQGGFRVDWAEGGDTVTLQGDANQGDIENDPPAQKLLGGNLLGRWNHSFADGSALQVQAYFDYSQRQIPGQSGDSVAVYDLEVQHSFSLGWNSIVWGGDYRISDDNFTNAPTGAYFDPDSRILTLGDIFAQDNIALADDLTLTAGLKLENNSYTGLEPMPDVRLAWKFSPTDLLWAAVSRAVRTPARIDRDVYEKVGSVTYIDGGQNFQDEILTAYELGYRTQFLSRASLSISTYYNVYDDLRSLELSSTGVNSYTVGSVTGYVPIFFGNKMEGQTYGIEIWGDYAITDGWRLSAGLDEMREQLHPAPGSLDIGGISALGNDPKTQFSLRSSVDLPYDLTADVGARYVSALPNPAIPAYVEMDARLAWRATDSLEFALIGSNLLHAHHQEFSTSELDRNFSVSAQWLF